MAYTTLEKMRLEEYKRNKALQKSGGTSINMSTSTIDSNITLPTAQSNTWLKKAQGNVIQNTLGTTGDILLNLGKGANSIGEGAKNTVASAFINAASPLTRNEKLLTGTDHLEEWRNQATQNVLNFNPISDVLDKTTEKVDKYSVLGDKSDSIAQGIGYYGGMVALETLGIPWQATSAVTGFGNSYEEAINEGSSRESAVVYSLGSAAAEVASEYLFSGLKLPGTGKTADKLIEAATDKIRNKVANQLVKFGVNTVGEGVEELVSGTASEVMKRLTYMKDEDKNMFQNIGDGISDYYKNQALDEFVSGVLVSAITGASSNLINKTQSSSKNENLELTDNLTKNSLSENIVTNNNLTNDNLYQYIESDNEKINNLRESAVEIGQFISNDKTNGVMNVAEKLISDKNYNIVFDNTITNENGNMVNAQITTLENGETEIRLNPNSDRAAEFLLIHEVSHGIKTQEMIDLVNDYANKNPEFKQAVKSLEQLYGKDLTSEEVFADVCGQLFGNQEFIMDLSTTKPSLFRRIYNKIVELANKITGNSNEALFIRDLKNKWENAYRTQNNNLDETNYSYIGTKGATNLQNNNEIRSALGIAKFIHNNSTETLENTNRKSIEETGWFKDKNGDWKFEIDDSKATVDLTNVKDNVEYSLKDILKHKELFEAYPELNDVKVKFVKMFYGTGEFVPEKKLIKIEKSRLNANKKNTIKATLLHEIQHLIQVTEGFELEKHGFLDVEGYIYDLGETEAQDVRDRFKYTPEERKTILPASAKTNSINSKADKIRNSGSKLEKTARKIYNNIKRKGIYEISDSMDSNNLETTERDTYNRSLRSKPRGRRGLDNSSFSYSKNDTKWQEHLEKNYKATGTKTKFSDMKSNITEQSDNSNIKTQTKKVMNPLEISKITKQDSNTTPILPTIKVSTGDGESKFADNIRNKTNMLSQKNKDLILSENEVKYYQKVTNKESLEKAFERLNKGGKSETENWLRKESENATSIDVAEGWILLKQYQDSIAKETDINAKNELNRSMVQVVKKMRGMATNTGQTMQAFNILNRLTPEGMVYYAQSELSEAYEKMSKNKTKEWIDSNRDRFELTPSETQFIMDTMQEVQQMEDGYDRRVKLAEIQKLMTDKLPPERGAGIKSWMRISMLFNPKTQVRNVMGNAVIAPVNSFSDLFASVVDRQIAKKTGIRTTGKTSGKNYAKGFKTGIYQSYNDFKKGINTRNMQGNRFEVTQGKSFNDNSFLGKNLNKVDSLLSFMLDAGDRGFYEASFTNSINNQMILNNTTEVTQDMIDIATSEALSRTWQDNNNYTKFVLQTRNSLNKINIKGYGLGDVLIPFAKTPANLTKAIVDYSPLGMINAINSRKNLKNSLNNGQYNAKMQHQFVQNLGKATAGTMLYILGYALAKAGITSGESDEDKDVKDFMKNTLGVSSYSIKIGNKTFTYDWAQPIAAPLSIMANIVNKQKEGATLTENIISSLDTAGNILLEQSFMESINTVLNNNEGIVTGIQEAIFELPSRAVPTLMKQIVDLTDDTQRTTFEYDKPIQTAVNKVKAKIPGLSKTLSPVVDTMGREVQRYGGKNNIFNVFFNPANVNTENISESAQEIYRVYKSTGDKTVMPRVIPYYFDEKGVKRTLTSTERSEFQKISGAIIEENVENLLNNQNYVNMNDTDKSAVLNNLVNYAYNKARYEMFGTEMSNQYNKVNEWTEQGGKVSDYYANKEENDYSLENPKKYNTMNTFNLSYEDYTKYSKEISNIKEQYNDTNSRKYAVWQYIQNQKITKVQKILLYNLCGGYSISNYKDYMFNYINNQNITKSEKQEIWNYLYK